MFNLSFGEIFVVIILAIIFIKPEDLPSIISNIKSGLNKLIGLKNDFLTQVDDIKDDFKDLENDLLDNNKIIKEDSKEKDNINGK